jgi:hypothetical protein
VHGEQLVVLLVGHDVLVRAEELDPDQQRHDPGTAAAAEEEEEEEEEECGDQVHVADHLVVGGRQPPRQNQPLTLRA